LTTLAHSFFELDINNSEESAGGMVSETRFIRAGFLPIQERDGNNAVTREYTWGLNKGGGIGGLLNLNQGGQNYSYMYDGKGNVMGLIDSAEAVQASYRYDVFGNLKEKTGTLDQPFQFSTKRYDELTGLSNYGFRFYNPAIGRWMTRDPLGESGGINLYGFVGNNPINFVDPYGLAKGDWWDPRTYLPTPPPPGPPGSGCGDEKTDCIVPDLYPEACKAHDKCYATPGKTQAQCDNQFWVDIFNESGPWPNVIDPTLYWWGVRSLGSDAYNRAQGK
jgi:RHS repeat-associated protein